MTKYYCDKCGKEIENSCISSKEKHADYNARIQMYSTSMDETFVATCFESFLCKDCFESMMAFLDKNCKRYDKKVMR